MYGFLDKHKRAVQVVLAMIALPFMFFGVDSYFRGGSAADTVATVNGMKISQREFEDALREHADRLREQMGKGYDSSLLDHPEVRYAVVENLVNQRLLLAEAQQERLRVTDAQLSQVIADIPAFHEDGRFSPERYRMLLQGQGMSPAMFEDRVRRELLQAPLQEPLTRGSIVAQASAARYLALLEQKREVAQFTVDAEPFAKEAKVDDAAVKQYYDDHPDALMTPEQARIEYAVLSIDALAAKIAIDPQDVRKQYDASAATYTSPAERSAAHILITVKPDASDADKAAAKEKAEKIAAQVRAAPARFAEIAKAESQDPGSAPQGGDLGTFGRGTMVKAFEDAAFGAKPGEIVGPVQSEFGWHVIKVTGARESAQRPFDEVKAQIEQELRHQRAQQKFQAAADQFQNLVYEQADSLEGVGKALDVPVQTTPFITRGQAQQLAMSNAAFAEALFAPVSIQAKRNTDAIEVAPSTLMAARIVEHKPAAPRPFDEVKAEIRRQLERKAMADAAERAGRAKLALLEQGKSDKEAGIVFGKPAEVARNQAGATLPPDALLRIFQAEPAKFPVYVTATNPRGGFSIYRVSKVIEPASLDEGRLKLAAERMGDQIGRDFATAYLASLKSRADVKIEQAMIEVKKDDSGPIPQKGPERPRPPKRGMPN